MNIVDQEFGSKSLPCVLVTKFPAHWPSSLVKEFSRLSESESKVEIILFDGQVIRGHATFSKSGIPSIGKILLKGIYSTVTPFGPNIEDTPLHITGVVKGRDGKLPIYWSMECDEPVVWVMIQ